MKSNFLKIPKIPEDAIKDTINRIEGSKSSISNEIRLDEVNWWGRQDLNLSPESPSLRAWTKLADGPFTLPIREFIRSSNLVDYDEHEFPIKL